MRVKLSDGRIMEVNAAYGARLIEQGKASVMKKEEKKKSKDGE